MRDAPLWATAWLTTMLVCVGAFFLDAFIEGWILGRPPGFIAYFFVGGGAVVGLCCIMILLIDIFTKDRDG
jgi:hypothetical protein